MSRSRLSPSFCVLLITGIVVGLAVLFLFSRSNRDVFIAVPYFKAINAVSSIEWIPEKATLPETGDTGKGHAGYQLATIHCTRCHLLPNPLQLPRETWPFVLTWMSNYLGYTNTYPPFSNNVEASLISPKRLISEPEFQELSEYFMVYAHSQDDAVSEELRLRPRPVGDRFVSMSPDLGLPMGELVSSVFFDDSKELLFVGRAQQRVLRAYDRDGQVFIETRMDSEPIDIDLIAGGFRVTCIGDFMEDKKRGAVVDFSYQGKQEVTSKAIVEGYHRLTESHTVDLDDDGSDDLLLIGFGAGSNGKVSIRWAGAVDETETKLLEHSGALNAQIHDFDQDGMDDIVLISSQSQQEILLFLNQGQRSFERRVIRKEVAGFGFNHLAIGDLDEDGLVDLVVVNGNNMEIKDAPLKSYHGVRVLKNRGGLNFDEIFFYPMFGALKSLVHDFDRDGDLDIATIAFYPDWAAENPETFAYLENQGEGVFVASGLAKKDSGRWISMSRGDVNNDGWEDVILGGGYILQGVGTAFRDKISRWSKTRPSVVVLQNQGNREVVP